MMIAVARAVWIAFCYAFVAVLWLALIAYPATWFDLPWWATLALAGFWLWQLDKAAPQGKAILDRGDEIIRSFDP